MQKLIHLIPYDGIGGVERASATMVQLESGEGGFSVATIFPSPVVASRWIIGSPLFFVKAVMRLWRVTPDVLIVSLWRACAVGIVLKLLRPRIRLVLFLHLPDDVHALDRFLTCLAARLASAVWADSSDTLTRRILGLSADKGRVVSFVTQRLEAIPLRPVRPRFVFWGRIHAQKGLSRALRLVAAVLSIRPDVQFFVIGPDGGDMSRIRGLADELGLGDSVQFLGPMVFSQIREVAECVSFYLQTSELEGMAMSVVEAMQLGLVPVVTPVGEIANYARAGENAVVVTDNATAVSEVLALLDDERRYQALRTKAIAYWLDKPLYKDDVLSACRELLGVSSSATDQQH